jgi:hypothetical protein
MYMAFAVFDLLAAAAIYAFTDWRQIGWWGTIGAAFAILGAFALVRAFTLPYQYLKKPEIIPADGVRRPEHVSDSRN